MLVGIDNCSLNIDTALVEPETNSEASNYISENYTKLIRIIKSLGIKEEKANDLLHDVFVSIIESESEGNAYDMEYSIKNGNDNIMLIEQFVIGRIKLYAKNARYRTDVVETGSMSYEKNVCVEEPVMSKKGYVLDKNGNRVMEKKYVREKVNIQASICAASYNQGSEMLDNNDSFQRAYAMATYADNLHDIDEKYSLRDQIDYCIDICSLNGVNIINILKNLDTIIDLLKNDTKKKKTSDSVFDKLNKLIEYHDELESNLMSIIRYSLNHKEEFDLVINTY